MSYNCYDYEIIRLTIFCEEEWDTRHTTKNSPSKEKLAAAGFHCIPKRYSSGLDIVWCHLCSLQLSNLNKEDNPLNLHKKAGPKCQFFKCINKNIPILYNSESNTKSTQTCDEREEESEEEEEHDKGERLVLLPCGHTTNSQQTKVCPNCDLNVQVVVKVYKV